MAYLTDPDDYASLSLDRSSYPPGADVHMTITSLAHNIDPTDEDSWTYNTDDNTVIYQLYDENGDDGDTVNNLDLGNLNFDDSASFTIDTDPNDVLIIGFRNNDDQNRDDDPLNPTVTILETEPNSGIFKNTDDQDTANVFIVDTAPRGFAGVIDFADSALSVPIRNYPGSLTMDISGIGGTWNGGEEITVTLDDGDLNLNSLIDEDIEIENWNQRIPTVIVGTPLTLEDANSITVGATVYTPEQLNLNTFSKRALIEGALADTVVVEFTITNVRSDLFYFSNTIDTGLVQILEGVDSPAETVMVPLRDIPADLSNVEVADIFTFGQTTLELESAATTRNADAIYRMPLEETGDNTAMYTGSIEYTALNQLNVGELATYIDLAAIDDEITIIVPTDLTDEDAVRVDYLDTDGEGIQTQIGAQVDAPTHSGIVSFDDSNYKVADTVTVTLTDADLNTNSDTTEVYTTTPGIDNDNGINDRVGITDVNNPASAYGRLLDITFNDAAWTSYSCDLDDDDTNGNELDGLSTTGFTLIETTSTSGIFSGTFQIPQNYCEGEDDVSTTTGRDLEVNYVDYSDASGELIEVGDSAGISANTGSVSFDRSVYPVPFDPILYPTQNGDETLDDYQSISGNTVLHIRVNDPDYDISGSGSDTLPANTLRVEVIRGSQTSGNLAIGTDPIRETSPSSGIFELDLELPSSFTCDVDEGCDFADEAIIPIQQGDIVTAEYTDATDASGNLNTVTDSATFDLRNAKLQTDKTAYIIGGDMILTLIEPDFDLDSDETESYPLNLIEWDSDDATLAMGTSLNFDPEPSVLRETGDSTGIFLVVIEIPAELEGSALDRGEQIDLEYIDYGPAGADNIDGIDNEDIELTLFTSNFGATISLDKKVYTWTDKVFVTITAPDHNFDSDLIDSIGDTADDPIKISTRENSIDRYRLVETGTDTGIFTGEVILTGFQHDADGVPGDMDAPIMTTEAARGEIVGPTDGFLEAEDVDGLTVSFEVSEDDTVIGSAIIRWNIGEIEWAEASYPASGNGLVRIVDPDLNLNPESVDNFDVDVWSDSDPGGISLTVTETNEATGVFEGLVSFTTTDESSGHRLRVAEGDTITAEYEDHTLPDPYDTTDDLDVLSTAIIGSVVAPLERAPVSNARIVDTQGQTLSTVSVDQQVLVSSDLRSGQDKDQVYAYLVQIQDADGVTVLLSWITGTLPAGSSSSPSQSWTPTAGGDYTATVFVWESITNPTALSPSDKVTIQVS